MNSYMFYLCVHFHYFKKKCIKYIIFLISLRADKEALLKDILRYCSREDRKHVENILLIGKSGAGKSAMINTVICAIVGEYLNRSMVGRGTLQTNTLQLLWYKNCGVKLEDLQVSSNEDFLQELVPKLPNLFDWAGQCDENSPALAEKLKYLIGGYIEPGTSILALDKLQEEHGVGEFGSIFEKANPDWKITKIVFVQSCQEQVPKKLIKCLQSVIRASHKETGQLLYDVEIFTVISKSDLLPKTKSTGHDEEDIEIISDRNQPEQNNEPDSMKVDQSNSDKDVITTDEFRLLEDSVANELSIEGSTKVNSIHWVSYVDRTGFADNPDINNIALKFLKLMVAPSREKVEVQKALVPLKAAIRLKTKRIWRRIKQISIQQTHVTSDILILAIAVIVVLFILYYVLSASV